MNPRSVHEQVLLINVGVCFPAELDATAKTAMQIAPSTAAQELASKSAKAMHLESGLHISS